MLITHKWLKVEDEYGHYTREYFDITAGFGNMESVDAMRLLLCGKEYHELANWLIVRLLNHRSRVMYALAAVNDVLGFLSEPNFREDMQGGLYRTIQCVANAMNAWLGNPSVDTIKRVNRMTETALRRVKEVGPRYGQYAIGVAACAIQSIIAPDCVDSVHDAAYLSSSDECSIDPGNMEDLVSYGIGLLESEGER